MKPLYLTLYLHGILLFLFRLSTAKGMGIVGQQMNAKFALAVGDNFYSTGIRTDVHDQRFKSTFEVR